MRSMATWVALIAFISFAVPHVLIERFEPNAFKWANRRASSSRLAIRMEKCELALVSRSCGYFFSEVAFVGSLSPRVCINRVGFVWHLDLQGSLNGAVQQALATDLVESDGY